MNNIVSVRHEIDRRDYATLRDSFGPLAWSRLEDKTVTDLLLNSDGSLFEDREGVGMSRIGSMSEHSARTVINLVAAVAGEVVGRNACIVEATLPIRNGRFIGFIPPITEKPSFAIRLPPSRIYTLPDYVAAGFATEKQLEAIENAVLHEQNILVSGGTKSGKSTLLNAMLEALHRLHPDKRVGLIEEIMELQYHQHNVLALRTGTDVDHQDLLKRLMRARPDVLVFGEVRDKAALQLVKACNTGHGTVMSTIHANTPVKALGRMENLCAEALPGVSVREQIADAIGVVVGIARLDPAKRKPEEPERRITQIIKVEGITNEKYDFSVLA